MIISAKFRSMGDINTHVLFTGDPIVVQVIQETLKLAGVLQQRSNCIVIKHPVTGLECALSPGDEVQYNSSEQKFIVIQHDLTALPWCRIEFAHALPPSGTPIVNHVLRCDLNRGENVRVMTLCAAQPCVVKLRIRDKTNEPGEIVYTGDVPWPKSAVERQSLPVAFTYRGHEIRVWSEGAQFVILHTGVDQENIENQIGVEIYIK